MHNTIFFCAFVFMLSIKTNAQINLVPNYSFEDYTTCPSGGSQISLAIPWYGTNNSTDYFNSCAPLCSWSVPCQFGASISYQYAHTGVGMAGIFMVNGPGGDYREYLQAQLLDTLLSSTCYKVTFYTNLLNNQQYAVNNFGVYLSNNSFTTSWGPPGYTPQILGFNNKIINDTLNWVEISGIYVASGGEKYITLGNFFDDTNTDTLNTGYTGPGSYVGGAYFFDDISVIPIDSILGGMPAYAGVDTNVTLGDSVFIGQQISNLNCNWYNAIGSLIASGTSGIYVNPTTSTYYVVEQNLCGTITYDTVNVIVLPTSINELFNENNVQIYPNPSTGLFNINLIDKSISELNILIKDVMGKIVYTNDNLSVSESKADFKLNVQNGVYFVTIISNSTNESITKKLIINK